MIAALLILSAAALLWTLLILACCRAAGRASGWERDQEDEVARLEALWKL